MGVAPPNQRLRILVSGATGFIGSALVPVLQEAGHTLVALTHSSKHLGLPQITWQPNQGILDKIAVENFDAVIHLAGENLVGRWNPEKKQRIWDSRVRSTRLLCDTLASLTTPPRALVCASAIGYYGNRGDELLTEASPPGGGFLADLCQAWEAATEPVKARAVRVVNLRFGVILSLHGGALAPMLRLFRLGLGGHAGTGRQFLAWITLADVIGVVRHALFTDSLYGPANATSPQPVRNCDFARLLGKFLHRPSFFAAPEFALRLLLGEMADETILVSQRAIPKRLQDTGYVFQHPELEDALRSIFTKSQK
jgi:uncharacterized protein